jgi:hypothetical protein
MWQTSIKDVVVNLFILSRVQKIYLFRTVICSVIIRLEKIFPLNARILDFTEKAEKILKIIFLTRKNIQNKFFCLKIAKKKSYFVGN